MAPDWKGFPGAPAPGTPVCKSERVREGVVLSLDVAGFPLLVLRREARIVAYVNACPHQFLPLDHRGNALLSQDGARLMCSNHNAQFLASDGTGVAGEGLGCALSPVPMCEADGNLVIGD